MCVTILTFYPCCGNLHGEETVPCDNGLDYCTDISVQTHDVPQRCRPCIKRTLLDFMDVVIEEFDLEGEEEALVEGGEQGGEEGEFEEEGEEELSEEFDEEGEYESEGEEDDSGGEEYDSDDEDGSSSSGSYSSGSSSLPPSYEEAMGEQFEPEEGEQVAADDWNEDDGEWEGYESL